MYREYDEDASINIESLNDYYLTPGGNIILTEWVDWSHEEDQALIIPRSKAFSKGMLIPTTLLDVGYKGHLRIFIYNMTDTKLFIRKGDSVAQIVPIERRKINVPSTKGKRPYKDYPTDISPSNGC